jgi:PAS domain S-box-containing protein
MPERLQSRRLQQQVINSITDHAVIATDLDGRVIDWNAGAENVLGWTEAEMLGETIDRIFTPEDNAHGRREHEMRSALLTGRGNDERWHLRRDGSRFWASGSMTVLRDEVDAAIGFVKVLRDDTLSRRNAEALRASEERYRSLFDNIDAGFCIIEMRFDAAGRAADFRFLEVNPAFERQTGLVEAQGKWMRTLVASHEQHWFDLFGRVAATGEPTRMENRALALGDRWYDVLAFRVGAPEAWRVAVLFTDVSARRRAELALRQFNESLEERIEQRTQERDRIWQVSQDMLGVADEHGVWQSINPAWSRILGWPAERIVGRNSAWLEHPDDTGRMCAEIERLTAGQATVALESRLRTGDGDFRLLSWRAVLWQRMLYCVARDVTVERERERALRDAESFTRLALTAVGGVGAWTFDVARGLFVCDAAVAELYGLDPDAAAAGVTLEAMLVNVHPDDLAWLPALAAADLPLGRDMEVEYRIRHPDGRTRWVLSRSHTYVDAAGQPTRRAGVGIETTTQHLLQDQLRQSQKMEAVGQLTGGLAHDFNNLLTGITGNLEMLSVRVAQGRSEQLERYIAAAQGAASRAAALTHRLLAFSRQQTLDPKPTDVNGLVGDMVELIRRTVGPAISVVVASAPDLWTTLVDPNQLENALLNLSINARDAMPGGGRLTIETSNRRLDETAARRLEMAAGSYLSLSVSDNGTGMTPEVLARAFDPFFTTKPLGQGTGLGLSMIYGFARQSGGQVRIHSQPGEGTTVSLLLPRHDGKIAATEVLSVVGESPRAESGQTVLVVDDEPTIRMLVAEVLDELGYTAIEAANGAAGLLLLQSDARIDLVVTDVGLPGGINGRQMADAARAVRPALKVLFITGYAETAAIGQGQLDPGMQVLTKPFAMDVLALRIKTLIGSS